MICDICGNEYRKTCLRCARRVMIWGVDGVVAIRAMANRTDDIPVSDLLRLIREYYTGVAYTNSDRANVLRISLKKLGYKGKIIGRIHTNKIDYMSIRKREYSAGLRWRLRNDNCDKCGSTDGLKLHHIVPIAWGGLTSKENCITLCQICHKLAHKALSKVLNRTLLLQYLIPHKDEIYDKAIASTGLS